MLAEMNLNFRNREDMQFHLTQDWNERDNDARVRAAHLPEVVGTSGSFFREPASEDFADSYLIPLQPAALKGVSQEAKALNLLSHDHELFAATTVVLVPSQVEAQRLRKVQHCVSRRVYPDPFC